MIISLIAAIDKNRVIGKENALPWHLPADLKHFRDLTLGKPIIMGRKTFESIGKPLARRTNIVLTNDQNFQAQECVGVHSVDEAIAAAGNAEEAMVIGGAQIFDQFLLRAQKMYLTILDIGVDGDTYFPAWNPEEWEEIAHEKHGRDDEEPYYYTFVTLQRKK